MNNKIKTSIVSLLIVFLLTIIKFIFYYISGSIAVLSEAWHSFSDIATTSLVLISIIFAAQKKNKQARPSEQSETKFFTKLKQLDPELIVSFIISILLLSISLKILWSSFFAYNVIIAQPLFTGIAFIIASFGSYFVYRFEYAVSLQENSPALRADSFHNRTDMVISLLTGFSLIIYYFGYNIDRWVGAFIAILILTFSLEMIANIIIHLTQKRTAYTHDFKVNRIILSMFNKDFYIRIIQWFDKLFGLNRNTEELINTSLRSIEFLKKWFFRLSFTTLLILYAQTSFYKVAIDQEALLLRFGEIVNKEKPIGSGLHSKYPWPIDSVKLINSKKIKSVFVGNKSVNNSPMIWAKDHGDRKMFISSDNNFFLPYGIIHYKIKNIHKYYLNNIKPEEILQKISYQVFTTISVKNKFYDLALFKRADLIEIMKNEIQYKMDEFNTGIEIVSLNIKDLHPPVKIASSFENVVAAFQQKQNFVNNAIGQKYVLLPQARSKALNIINEAQSSVNEKLQISDGEAINYKLRRSEYEKSKNIIKTYMKLKAAEIALKDNEKIIIDPETKLSSEILYFEQFMSKNKRFIQ